MGRRFGPTASRWLFAGERGTRRRAWAQRSLAQYGIRIIVACRFIPGGRTAVTLTCGLIGYPQRRFMVGTAIAGILWASYAFSIGRLGGQAFEGRPWAGLLVGLGLALVVSGVIEAVRRLLRRARGRRSSRPGPAAGPDPDPDPEPAGPGPDGDPGPGPRTGTRGSTSPAQVLQTGSTGAVSPSQEERAGVYVTRHTVRRG